MNWIFTLFNKLGMAEESSQPFQVVQFFRQERSSIILFLSSKMTHQMHQHVIEFKVQRELVQFSAIYRAKKSLKSLIYSKELAVELEHGKVAIPISSFSFHIWPRNPAMRERTDENWNRWKNKLHYDFAVCSN